MLTFFIDIDLLDRIDDFRFDNRFPTRAGAIRWLLEWASSEGTARRDLRRPEGRLSAMPT
jgi:hypothetical protein